MNTQHFQLLTPEVVGRWPHLWGGAGRPASRAAKLVLDRAGCRRDDLERGRPSAAAKRQPADPVASSYGVTHATAVVTHGKASACMMQEKSLQA